MRVRVCVSWLLLRFDGENGNLWLAIAFPVFKSDHFSSPVETRTMARWIVASLCEEHIHSRERLGRHIDGLVQERRKSSALAMELRLSCTNPSVLSEWKPVHLNTFFNFAARQTRVESRFRDHFRYTGLWPCCLLDMCTGWGVGVEQVGRQRPRGTGRNWLGLGHTQD